MALRLELGFPKAGACSLREQAARTILRNVRSHGHTYIELREDGKKFVFFCTLCLARCYSDTVLFDHLKGNLHAERLSAAKVTLFGPNPWPFNDGVVFFDNSVENEKDVFNARKSRLLELQNNGNNLAIVKYSENSKTSCNGHDSVHSDTEISSCDKTVNANGVNSNLLVPGVRIWNEISAIEVHEAGFGQIAARFHEKDKVLTGISRIWCDWLGKRSPENEDMLKVSEHDFAVVTFRYNCDIGSKELFDHVKPLLLSSPTSESENGEGHDRKKKKAFSDPEDISESSNNQYDSSGEDSPASNGDSSRLLLAQYDDQLLQKRFISSKAIRRELRQQQRAAAERMCDICQHKMLPGKDVSALMNMKTGRLVCSSRNVHGAFHVFHTSCVIHWILLCEFEIITKELVSLKLRRRSKRKNAAKCSEMGNDGEVKATRAQINSVFCPECQGTGIIIEGDELEKPTVPLSEMFRYKLKVSDAKRAWMKSPEVSGKCSTGFHFPYKSEETIEEKVKPLKLLRFYESDI